MAAFGTQEDEFERFFYETVPSEDDNLNWDSLYGLLQEKGYIESPESIKVARRLVPVC